MFTNPKQLIKRSGKKGIDRADYLKELVDEFQNTQNKDAKEQVIANLANFSYDPLNHQWLIDLNIINIFLQNIAQSTGLLQQFSITGICNLSAKNHLRASIINHGGIAIVSSLLNSANEKCIIDAISALIFLTSNQNKKECVGEKALNKIQEYCSNENPRIRNLAIIFMSDINI